MKTPQQTWHWVVARALHRTTRSRRSATLHQLAGVLLLSLTLSARATTYYVNGGVGNNAYDGLTNIVVSSVDGPKLNVSNAVAAAFNGDTLAVADGFYQETNWDLTGKNLTLNPDGTVIVYSGNPWSTYTIGDGISDGWREYYFADPTMTNGDSCASCGPDGDGQSNYQEYLASSDPLEYYSGPLQPPLCFTNQLSTNTAVIAIQPATNGCIFYAGESATVTSSAPIEIYRLTYGGQAASYTNGASPLVISPPIGHYFVQSANDRNEFVVFPSNYGTLNNVGHGDSWVLQGVPEIGVHQSRAKLNWVRAGLHWSAVQITNGAAFDWTALYNGVPDESNLLYWVGKEKIILMNDPASSSWSSNLTFAAWITAYSNFMAASYVRYAGDVDAVQVLNEPNQAWAINSVFTNGNYSSYQISTYKAIASAFPGKPFIGPSEDTPNAVYRVAWFADAGGTSLVSALDYHDYTSENGAASPENVDNGVIQQALTNLTTLGATNLYLTEVGLGGASPIGWPRAEDLNASHPLFNWYLGLTRAMKVAALYEQFNATILPFNFMDNAPIEIAGFDPNGGIKPKTSAFLMTEHWLNGSTPLTNWVSGNLHFVESIWTNGTTNTFVWSSEGTTSTTNLSAFVSDVWSNGMTNAISEEPVIAWGWPPP